MKMKFIAGAVAALCSVSAFAATVNPVTDTPDSTFFIVGASAQKPGIQSLLTRTDATNPFFDAVKGAVQVITSSTPADVIGGVTDNSGANTLISKSNAYFGWDARDNSKKLLVLLNTANGSAAGVNQLLSADTDEKEADNVTVGSGCVAQTAANTWKCSDHAKVEADIAFSDVYANELVAGALTGDPSNLNEKRALGLQGFGVIVSPNLYLALQQQNIADNLLPSTCVTVTGTPAVPTSSAAADCQPSISKTAYFNVVASAGTMHSAAALLPNVTLAAKPLLSVQRRVFTSGTQASSAIYFLNSPCGDLDARNFEAVGATPSDGTYEVIENPQSDDVINNVKAATGSKYAIGLVSLEKSDSSLGAAKWVKLNGVSPNYYNLAGAATSAESTHRAAMLDGRYDLAMEIGAYWGNTPQSDLVDKLLTTIVEPGESNLPGVAYLSGSVPGKTAKYSRASNNCNALQ